MANTSRQENTIFTEPSRSCQQCIATFCPSSGEFGCRSCMSLHMYDCESDCQAFPFAFVESWYCNTKRPSPPPAPPSSTPPQACGSCIVAACPNTKNLVECRKCMLSNYALGALVFPPCWYFPFGSAVDWHCDALAPAPPPTPPAPPAPPSSSWPTFQSKAALAADPWGKYYEAVYGELPSQGFPIETISNWFVYDATIVSSRVTNIPASVGSCPANNPPAGQRYNINDMYSPSFTSWVWHPYPWKAMAANTWQEVIHQADPFGDEHFGAWFIYAPGSGIYFNLGNTISFDEHDAAYKHFNVKAGNLNEELSKAAAAANYDSLQFLAHVDHVNYQCDTHNTGHAGLDYMGIEILAAKLVGTYACGGPAGAPPTVKAGWQASKPCECDNKMQYLNCQGVPTISSLVRATSNISVVLV